MRVTVKPAICRTLQLVYQLLRGISSMPLTAAQAYGLRAIRHDSACMRAGSPEDGEAAEEGCSFPEAAVCREGMITA